RGRAARDAVEEAPAEQAPAERRREREVPHPALSASAPEQLSSSELEEEPPEVPSPKERLRNVFSSEIPENIMERPQAREQAPASRHAPVEMPPREEPRPYSTADQVIHPVIRV